KERNAYLVLLHRTSMACTMMLATTRNILLKCMAHHALQPVHTGVNAHRYKNFNSASMLVRSIHYVQVVEDFSKPLLSSLVNACQMKCFHERGNLHYHATFSWSLAPR